MVHPDTIYRYQRYPGNPAIAYENRLQLNLTVSTSHGPWKPILRTLIEGRFPDDRPASARLRFRPGVEYTLPIRTARQPVLVVNNEFFLVPWYNPFTNGGSSYTQNRFQIGVRFPIADTNTFAGIRQTDVLGFMGAQFAGALHATLYMRWQAPRNRPAHTARKSLGRGICDCTSLKTMGDPQPLAGWQ